MLVLSRRIGESVVVVVPASDSETKAVVTVMDIRCGTKARLGFEAPLSTVIHRQEVYDKIRIADGDNSIDMQL